MGIQINGNTDNISATDGGLTVSDLELNQTGVSTFHSHLHVADQIIHLDDANSKIRFPAADTITAETAGTERLRIDSSGRVGIGTNTPTDILDVYSTTDPTIRSRSGSSSVGANIEICGGSSNDSQLILSSGTTNKYQFFRDGSQSDDLRIYDSTNSLDIIRYRHGGYLHFGVNGTERLRITSGGDMGLGTNSPASSHDRVLTIAGTNSAELKLTGSNYGVTDTDGADVLFSYGGLYLINNESTGNIHFHTGSGVPERLRITSAGKVGIGTNNPSVLTHIYDSTNTSTATEQFRISGGNRTADNIETGFRFFTESPSVNGNRHVRFTSNGNTGLIIQPYETSTGNAAVDRNIILCPSGGKVTLGTTTEGYADADDLTLATAANTGMTIRAGASNYGSIFFSDATSGTGEYDGFLQYSHANQRLMIGAASATKLNVFANGHLNTQGNNTGNPVGMELRNNNTAAYSHAELTLTSQNATSSKIWCDVPNARMRFQYNGGSTVGIDQSGNVQLASGSGIAFSASSNFATMSSEILDDYEEGYWTPTIGGHAGDGSTSYGNQKGSYVRIGGIVHLNWYISWTSTTASGQFRIFGQPFNAATTHGTNYNITTGSMMFDNINVPYANGQTVPYLQNAATFIVFYSSYSTGGWTILSHDSYTQNGGSMIASISYRAA